MKYNWASVASELRFIVLKHVKIDSAHSEDFRVQLLETDRFHPFDSDEELGAALREMPDRCNYRSIKSYWDWKNGRFFVEEAIFECLIEMGEKIEEYYQNRWNHAPGYQPAIVTVPAWDDIAGSSFARIIRAAKTARPVLATTY